jgi:hypothetical protein
MDVSFAATLLTVIGDHLRIRQSMTATSGIAWCGWVTIRYHRCVYVVLINRSS